MIQQKLLKDIKSYCEINNIDINKFINTILKKAFLIEKYGEAPNILKQNNKKIDKQITKYNISLLVNKTDNKDNITITKRKLS